MNNTSKIKCPFCSHVQSEDLYEFVDTGDQEGSFHLECESCDNEFTINFEFRPFVKTTEIGSE